MKITIQGCGFAGPTLAWWLRRHGHEPMLLERADALRTGGYLIDFWGTGHEVAERMALLPALEKHAYHMQHLRTVTARGWPTSSIDATVFERITDGRYFSIARSDLATEIFRACDGIETRFGTEISRIDDRGDRVVVTLSDGTRSDVDLVVGADGLHSSVRRLVFGPQDRYERHLGLHIAAFTLPGYRPRDGLAAVSHTLPGRYLSRVSLRDDRALFMMIVADERLRSVSLYGGEVRRRLGKVFRDTGWESDAISNLASVRILANWMFGRTFRDRIGLPDYG